MTDARRRADVNHRRSLIEQELDIVHKSQERCRELHMQIGRVIRDDSCARELCHDRGQSLPSFARCLDRTTGLGERLPHADAVFDVHIDSVLF